MARSAGAAAEDVVAALAGGAVADEGQSSLTIISTAAAKTMAGRARLARRCRLDVRRLARAGVGLGAGGRTTAGGGLWA
jgi:hypothetical protein